MKSTRPLSRESRRALPGTRKREKRRSNGTQKKKNELTHPAPRESVRAGTHFILNALLTVTVSSNPVLEPLLDPVDDSLPEPFPPRSLVTRLARLAAPIANEGDEVVDEPLLRRRERERVAARERSALIGRRDQRCRRGRQRRVVLEQARQRLMRDRVHAKPVLAKWLPRMSCRLEIKGKNWQVLVTCADSVPHFCCRQITTHFEQSERLGKQRPLV